MAAATGSSLRGLSEEATYSICLDYFKDPVTIECGHNFCRACLAQTWKGSEGRNVSCPECRQEVRRTLLFPNWQLATLAEKLSRLEGEKAPERNGMCEKHQEPIKLFCQGDKTLICVVCHLSKEHQGHQVLPLEEAALEYQKQTEAETEKMKEEFRKLHQFLEERETLLLAQLEETEKEIARKTEEHLARFSKELSSLEGLIQEMEQKRQQPPRELLQDIGILLQTSVKKETSENPVAFHPELKWKIWDFCDINPLLEHVMNQFKDALLHGLQLQKANVTLDPETAHPKLVISEDHKSVTYGNTRQYVPDNPQRFDKCLIVLGKERFTAGRHFWEVVVGSEEYWLAGVTRESVERKGSVVWSPKGGLVAVGKWGGGYGATSQQKFTCFSPGDDPKRIRVSLNCAAGRVAFYNADTAAHLYTFSEASFEGETFLPFFNVSGEACITISS